MALRLCLSKMGQKLPASVAIRHLSNKIVSTDDESTFIAWHPKQDYPYECTQPLPEPKFVDETSVLKTQYTPELMSVYFKKSPDLARLELMSITHTSKHRWFPRSRDKRAKKTPMDRQYL